MNRLAKCTIASQTFQQRCLYSSLSGAFRKVPVQHLDTRDAFGILVNAAHAVIAVQAIICKHSLTPDVTRMLNKWILIQGMSLPQGRV